MNKLLIKSKKNNYDIYYKGNFILYDLLTLYV